jgi:hypothetical protein
MLTPTACPKIRRFHGLRVFHHVIQNAAGRKAFRIASCTSSFEVMTSSIRCVRPGTSQPASMDWGWMSHSTRLLVLRGDGWLT